tara:strand:+ start:501 stop:1397 length:897 start_codon:yes stop_codon:yes gene_type:complete
MNVNIMLSNLKPQLWEMVADSVRFVAGALESQGAKVKIGSSQLDPEGLNLFFDRFYTEPGFPNQMKMTGVKYGLICTEVITPDGTWNYGAEGDDPATIAAFELAAKNAEFVWCLLEESVVACTAINPNTAYLPFGYLEQMETIKPLPADERDIDFLMCGIPCDRRQSLVNEIADAGHEVYYPAMPVPTYLRDALMARSRVNLSLQKTDHHSIVSVTRICHSVINRVPVLLEHAGAANPYTDLCITAGRDEIIQTADDCMGEIDLAALAEQSYETLKANLPMDIIMTKVLNTTWPNYND